MIKPSEKQPTLEEWNEQLSKFDAWNERVMMAIYVAFGMARSHLDLGSGTGAMIRLSRGLGVDAVGVDQIARPPDLVRDLTRPIDLGRKFHLVTCIEVAEHIPQQYEAVFVNNVARHVAKMGLCVWTSADPGQRGDGHINCKPAFYWRSLLWDRGLAFQEEFTHKLRLIWSMIPMPMVWLPPNLQVFVHWGGK